MLWRAYQDHACAVHCKEQQQQQRGSRSTSVGTWQATAWNARPWVVRQSCSRSRNGTRRELGAVNAATSQSPSWSAGKWTQSTKSKHVQGEYTASDDASRWLLLESRRYERCVAVLRENTRLLLQSSAYYRHVPECHTCPRWTKQLCTDIQLHCSSRGDAACT